MNPDHYDGYLNVSTHELEQPRRFRYPGGKDGMWAVECSCGYRTSPYPSPQAALKPAKAHLAAKAS